MGIMATFGILVGLAFIAGGLFGYSITTMVDAAIMDKKNKEKEHP